MRWIFSLLALSLLLLVTAPRLLVAAEQSFKIRPIRITTCDDVPTSARELFNSSDRDRNFEVTYLVEGENIVGIKENSLRVERLVLRDGRDLMKSAGKDFIQLDSFRSNTSADRKYASFNMLVRTNEFQKTDGLMIQGSITVTTASEHRKASGTMKIGSKDALEIGPFKVTSGEGEKDAIGEGLTAGFSQMFGGNQPKESVSVTVTGPLDRIITIAAVSGTTETEPHESYSGATDVRTYKFAKPAGETLQLSIDSWKEFQERTISFGDNPQPQAASIKQAKQAKKKQAK